MPEKRITSITVMLLLFMHCIAQEFTMKNLSVEEGLSNNYVRDIVQDGQGFIWIATESGLNRFDGQHFTTYTISNSDLQNDAINRLLYDKYDNLLWIGTNTFLYVLDCSTFQFTQYTSHDGIPIQGIVDLELSGDSALWIVNHHSGIVHYTKKTNSFTAYSGKNIHGLKNSNWCCFDDGKGHLYVGHAQEGLSIINLSEKTVRHFRHDPENSRSLPGNSVNAICMDHMGNIWIGTNQGLALFNQRQEDFWVFMHEADNPYSLIADHIYDIKEMSDGALWIASDIGGISILDLYSISFANPETVRFTNLTATGEESALSSGNIRSLLLDSFGNIWIGNYSSGVDFISHTQPPFHTLPYTLKKAGKDKNKPVWSIYTDTLQQVWVGSENEIALFKDNRLLKTIDISPYLLRPYAQVFSMIGNQHGVILLGLYDDGLLQLNTETEQIKRIDLGMNNIDIITFCESPDSTLWIGAEYGIYTYCNGRIRKEEKISAQLTDKSVYGILYDCQGKLWVGSYGGGISVFDTDSNLLYRLDTRNGFFSNAINHICLDAQGGVWIATRSGVGYVKDTRNPNHFEWYGTQEGLVDPFVRSIREDLYGNIWVSTNQGISMWDKYKRKFNNYDHRDGIPSGNFIEGSSCLTADGSVYFGSLNGVCHFNPQEVVTERPVAPIQIIECKGLKNHSEYLLPLTEKEISLQYHQNSIRISFSVPDYSQNRQVEYAYQAEGLQDVWSDTFGENHVTFRNIPPGKYRFDVKARLKNQNWDDSHIATLMIHIHPPFWLTWYAKFIYILLIALVIFRFTRFYKRRLELRSALEIERRNNLNEQNLNQERLQFYSNITHELRTPLTLILGPLEDLTYDKNLPAPYHNIIKTIHSSAVRLLNLVNQLLEFRKTESRNRKLTVTKGDLSSLVAETGLRYKELNRNPRLTILLDIKTNQTPLYFDADIITIVLDNLLSNAVKYTPEGKIELSLQTAGKYTEIKVTDTGCGIEPDVLPYIFDRYYQVKGKHQVSGTGIGLALVKYVTDLHEGILEVESTPSQGTTFTFRIITGNTYPDALHKEADPLSIQETSPVPEDTEEPANTSPVMLIVEDNIDIREYISSSFGSEFGIITATNGKEGLEQAVATIPDIIVSDIMMPEMDGIQFCRILKGDIRTSHIPVILLTAKDTINDKEEGYESGADSYLTKPFSAKLLRSRIKNLLESRTKLAKLIEQRMQGLTSDPAAPESTRLSELDEAFLHKLTQLIEENLDNENLDIPFIAQRIAMSHSTFYRKVKGLTGISANEFIRKVKLKNSLKLLLSGIYNISEAAYMTGFNNLGYFRECFKEEYGMSPSAYLKKNK